MSGFFITGTDTGCGKTVVSLGLMQLLQNRGESVLGMKPVASGAEMLPEGLRNEDALQLQAQGSFDLPYSAINPYVFEPPIAPHLAAEQASENIDLSLICAHYRALAAQADCVVVEGVGGWRVPLNKDQAVSDLARALGLPIVLVVGLRLGCINHALLSVESILASGAHLIGWVANEVVPGMLVRDENIAVLKERIGAPCFGVVPFASECNAKGVSASLKMPV